MLLNTTYNILRNKLQNWFKVFVIAVVVLVNIFVFLSNTTLFDGGRFKAFNIIVEHADNEHQINKSPFAIALSITSVTKYSMHQSPVLPVSPLQILFALFAASIIIGLLNNSRFCFIRDEETRPTLYFPSIIVPPPDWF